MVGAALGVGVDDADVGVPVAAGVLEGSVEDGRLEGRAVRVSLGVGSDAGDVASPSVADDPEG